MAIEPYDELEIKNDDTIIRRVNPIHHVVPDENTGGLRTSSKLFSPSSDLNGGMSVDILRLIENAGLSAKDFVTTPVYTGAVCFSAGSARTAGLRVGYDPIKDIPGVQDNPYHGEVWGTIERPNKFTQAHKRALVNASIWFVELPGVEIKL